MRTDDGSIIQDCLDGESEAFGILVDKYKAGIYAFAYSKLGNFQDAQDITQEVFLEAYSNLRKLRRWDSFSFWIYRMASTLCKKWVQNQMKRPDLKHIDDLDTGSLETPSVNFYRENKLYESVRDALDSLPETYREVLMLHYFAGMDSKEIATALGLSPTAIRMRISRAREQLREEMIAMMGTAFEEQRLQASFTFRIVEAVKRIKINPISQMKGLPWGISLATGLLITVLSINPALISFDHIGMPIYSPLPVESKVLKVGEIPVDVVKTSNIAVISSKMGKGNGGEPKNMQNTFFMAPQGEGGEWAKKADMPTARLDTSSVFLDGKIYVIGGTVDCNGLPISVVEEYNPVTDIWTKKADMPTARTGPSSIAVKGKIYAIGGTKNDIGWPGLPTVEEYDPATDKWTKKADMPTPRYGLSTSVVNGKIYAIGGCLRYPFPDVGVPTAAVEEYNPETDTWTKKADMPTLRWYHSSSVINGKIYAIGGTSDDQRVVLAIVEEYDPATDTWTRKADMPTARMYLCTSASGGRIYAFGGSFIEQIGGQSFIAALKTVEEYSPETDTWTKMADMPTARYLLTASVVNGKIYVIGGVVGGRNFNWNPPAPEWQGLSTIEEYTPDNWQPEQSVVSPQGKLPKTWGNIKSR
jgi:RNA polymerase sigma factor (sigma-70 family)